MYVFPLAASSGWSCYYSFSRAIFRDMSEYLNILGAKVDLTKGFVDQRFSRWMDSWMGVIFAVWLFCEWIKLPQVKSGNAG